MFHFKIGKNSMFRRKINYLYISLAALALVKFGYSLCQNGEGVSQNDVNSSGRKVKRFYTADLKDKDYQVINITHFSFIINPPICDIKNLPIVTLIHTACQNKAARDVIRQTWGKPTYPDIKFVNTRLVFLLGLPENSDLQNEITKESDEFGDMVQGSFVDNYQNMSYKNIFGKLWVSEFCSHAEFVIKTDDDMYVDLYGVYAHTRQYLNHEFYQSSSFFLCPVFREEHGVDPIIRDRPGNKWSIGFDILPRDEDRYPGNATEFYPDNCKGSFYILNPGTARRLVQIAKNPKTLKFLWIDDVWVTGYLAKDLNIKHISILSLWTTRSERLMLMKSAQNPDIYHRDYLSGPQHRDYKTSLAMHRQAQWCWIHKCLSNVYNYDREPTKDEKLNDDILELMFPLTDMPRWQGFP